MPERARHVHAFGDGVSGKRAPVATIAPPRSLLVIGVLLAKWPTHDDFHAANAAIFEDVKLAKHRGALLSVLIPTKNRYGTLLPVVQEITSRIHDDGLEVVVCDNSEVKDEAQVAALLALDSRVSYFHKGDDIPMSTNTERGIALCKGEYICFIGDDDLVSPHIVQIVEWMKAQDADCLIYPPARYWWSTVQFAHETRFQRPCAFWLPHDRHGTVRRHDSAAELQAVCARGGVSYMNLPRLYHGIVSRRAMERVRGTFGAYVPGSSPDMALCLGLALTTPSYLSLDYPVTVFGASRNSGGGWTAARKHYGRIEDQKHLPRNILDNWDENLPKIWSEQVVYPQTIHEVTSISGSNFKVNYPSLYASLLVYEPHIFRHLWPVLRKHVARQPGDIAPILFRTALKIAGRTRVVVRNKFGLNMSFDLHSFADISQVMAFMADLPPPQPEAKSAG